MEIGAVLILLVILVGISNVSKQMAFDRQMKEAVRYSQARSVGEAKALGVTPSRSALFWLGERRAYLKALQRWYKTPEGQDYLSFSSDMGGQYDRIDLPYEWKRHKEWLKNASWNKPQQLAAMQEEEKRRQEEQERMERRYREWKESDERIRRECYAESNALLKRGDPNYDPTNP